jgi:hypothetical protein
VCPCIPSEEGPQGLLDGLEEDLGHATRRRDAEGVADESGVLDSGHELELAQTEANRAPLAKERLSEATVVLAVVERPGAAQEIV